MSTQNVTPKIKYPMSIALTLALLLSVIMPAMAQADRVASGGIDSTALVQVLTSSSLRVETDSCHWIQDV